MAILNAYKREPILTPKLSALRGDKSAYTDKQKRQAEHIEEGYEKRGVPEEEAERRAWATVNKESGGGKKSGSGRRKTTNKEPAGTGEEKRLIEVTFQRSFVARLCETNRLRSAFMLSRARTNFCTLVLISCDTRKEASDERESGEDRSRVATGIDSGAVPRAARARHGATFHG